MPKKNSENCLLISRKLLDAKRPKTLRIHLDAKRPKKFGNENEDDVKGNFV